MDFQKDSQLFLRGRVGVELVYGFIPINDKKHIITISPNDDSGVQEEEIGTQILDVTNIFPLSIDKQASVGFIRIIMDKGHSAGTPRTPIEVIPERLYWLSDTKTPGGLKNTFYFNVDTDLTYQAFYADFGPLSLGKTYRFIVELEKLLNSDKYKGNQLYHFCSTDSAKSANAAYLMGAFQVVVLKKTAEQAYRPFSHLKFVAFRDASYGDCSYKCTILDCLRGLEYAIKLGWFDYKNFNVNEYNHYERVDNGDLNWIIPNKFIAFSSPNHHSTDNDGNVMFTPADYVPIFKKFDVGTVVRLNTKTYEASGFTKQGIKHVDLYFTDGTTPSQEIVDRFLQIAESRNHVLAIHCKAGLGRTGTLIALYAMKHYQFNAADFIGWIRICRPGSILGPQQHYLLEQQKIMKQKGKNSPIWKKISQNFDQQTVFAQMKSLSIKDKTISEQQKRIQEDGDAGQGQRLMGTKFRGNPPKK